MQYAPTWAIQSLSRIRFNKYIFIRCLYGMGRVVLHMSLNVSGGSIICPWSCAFVCRMQYAPTRTIQSFPEIRYNKYVFVRYLSRIGRGVLHMPLHVSGGSIICPWSWAFVGRMQYAPTRIIQYLPRIGFNKYVFISNLSGIDRCILHNLWNVPNGSIICPWSWAFVRRMQHTSIQTVQSLQGIGFNKYVFIRYLSRISMCILHTPQNVPDGSIICSSTLVFVGRIQYTPTQTIQSLPGIGFNKDVFIRYLSRIDMCILHTPWNVSGGSIICLCLWVFVGRMQDAPIRTIQSLSGIGFNKYVFIKYLYRIGRGVLHTPRHVSGRSIIFPWTWVFVGRMQYAPTQTIQSLLGIGFNKYIFIRYLSRICRVVLYTPRNVSGRSIICPWSWVFVGRMQYAPTRTI